MGKVCVHMNWRDKLGKKKKQNPGIALRRLSREGILSMNLMIGYHRKNSIKPPVGDLGTIKTTCTSLQPQITKRCLSSNKAGSFNKLLGCYITFSYESFLSYAALKNNPSDNNLIFPS